MKTHKTSLRNTRKTPSPLERVGVRLLFLLLPLWGTGVFSQNTYIDPTVTAAMILYSENLKAKQNDVIDETSKLKDAQAWVGTQMVVANDIQNKILKGLKEVSGTLQNGIQVKEIYSELNKCYTYSSQVVQLASAHPLGRAEPCHCGRPIQDTAQHFREREKPQVVASGHQVETGKGEPFGILELHQSICRIHQYR